MSSRPIVIDAHVHAQGWGFYPPRWHNITAERWAMQSVPPRDAAQILPHLERGIVDPDGSNLIKEMDHAEVDAAVCLTLDWAIGLGDDSGVPIDDQMRHFGELTRRHPGRFYAFAGIDPRRNDAVQLLRRAVSEYGLIGLKIYPPMGFDPADHASILLLKEAMELDIPVAVHTGLVGYPLAGRWANPLHLVEVQKALPDLTLILAHAGYSNWLLEAMRVAADHPHTYLEISMWGSDAKWDPGRVVRAIGAMRDQVGIHKLLFGSDHVSGSRFGTERVKPLPTTEIRSAANRGDRGIMTSYASFIRTLPEVSAQYDVDFNESEVRAIMGENAARVLEIGKAQV